MAVKRAVFLDKDGTLIPDIPFNVRTELITLSENMLSGLRLLQELGYIFIVISNQPGVEMGYFGHKEVLEVANRLEVLLAKKGIVLSGFYYCPHSPNGIQSVLKGGCNCRKPKPGLLVRAAKEHHIHLGSSWMIGDILNDIEAGNLAGCKTIMINNGNETEWIMTEGRTPDCISANIDEAAVYIQEVNKFTGYSQKYVL